MSPTPTDATPTSDTKTEGTTHWTCGTATYSSNEWLAKISCTPHGKQLNRLWTDCGALCRNPSVFRTCPRMDAYDRHAVFLHILNNNPLALALPAKMPPFVALVNIGGDYRVWTSEYKWLFVRLAQCVARGRWDALAPIEAISNFLDDYLQALLNEVALSKQTTFFLLTYSLPAFTDVHEAFWQIRTVRRVSNDPGVWVDDGPALTSDRPVERFYSAPVVAVTLPAKGKTGQPTPRSGITDAMVRAFVSSTTVIDWDATASWSDPTRQAESASKVHQLTVVLQGELKERTRKHNDEMDAIQAENKSLQTQIASVQAQCEDAQEAERKAHAEYLVVDTECAKLKKSLVAVEESKRRLEQQKHRAEEQHAVQSRKSETVHANTVDDQIRKLHQLQIQERAARRDVDVLSEQLQATQRALDGLLSEHESTRAEHAEASERLRLSTVVVRLQHVALVAGRRDRQSAQVTLTDMRKKCATLAAAQRADKEQRDRRARQGQALLQPAVAVCDADAQTNNQDSSTPVACTSESAVQTDMDKRFIEIDDLKQEIVQLTDEKQQLVRELDEYQCARGNPNGCNTEFEALTAPTGSSTHAPNPHLEHVVSQTVANLTYLVGAARAGGAHERAANQMAAQLQLFNNNTTTHAPPAHYPNLHGHVFVQTPYRVPYHNSISPVHMHAQQPNF